MLSTIISVILLKPNPFQKTRILKSKLQIYVEIGWKVPSKNIKDHPSTVCLKDKILNINNPKFSFNFVSFAQTLDEINKLDLKKNISGYEHTYHQTKQRCFSSVHIS